MTHTPTQKWKYKFLRRAHDTELWASYQPHIPAWLYLPAFAGVCLIIGAVLGVPDGQPASRILLAIFGLLLSLPIVSVAFFVRRQHERRAQVRAEMLNAISWRGDEKVLDVGCGSGMLLNGAAARLNSGQAIGIDIWAKHGGGGNLDLLYKHAQSENVQKRIQFREMDARKMTFADDSFDVVLSSWALHHICHNREDFEKTTQEILRVLKPNGTIVIRDIAHMIDAMVMRMEKARLQIVVTEKPDDQKMVVGKKSG